MEGQKKRNIMLFVRKIIYQIYEIIIILGFLDGFMSSQISNRINGKITYKLKVNLNDDKYIINTESNHYSKNKLLKFKNKLKKRKKIMM